MLRIVSKADSADSFIQIFSHLCDRESLFIVTRSPKEIGTETRFSINLKTGEPIISGHGQVTERYEDKDNPYGRVGMKLRFLELDGNSREFIERLVATRAERDARALPRPAAAPRPDGAQPGASGGVMATGAAAPSGAAGAPAPSGALAATPSGALAAGDVSGRAGAAREERAQGSEFILPANPFGELTDNVLEAFVECSLYEEVGSAPPDAPDDEPMVPLHALDTEAAPARTGSNPALGAPPQRAATPPPVRQGAATPPPVSGMATPPVRQSAATPPPVSGMATPVRQRAATPPPVPGMATPAPGQPPVPGMATPAPGQPPDAPLMPTPFADALPGPGGAAVIAATAPPVNTGAFAPAYPVGQVPDHPYPAAEPGPPPRRRADWRTIAIIAIAATAAAAVIGLGAGYVLWGGSKAADSEAKTAPQAAATDDAAADDAAPADGEPAEPPPREATAEPADSPGDTASAAAADPGQDEPAAATDSAVCMARINSEPGAATVMLGDRELGVTPLEIELPCGQVELQLLRARRDPTMEAVTLAPGTVHEVMVDLKRPAVELSIKSVPDGADVRLNGKSVGKTPVKVKVPGYRSAALEVSMDGYRPFKKKVYPKSPGTNVNARLRPERRRQR